MTTWEQEVAAELAALADGAHVVRDGRRSREVVVRPARLGGLVPGRRGEALPFVQAVRVADELVVEAVGSVQVGGAFPLTDAEHRQLLALGWETPGPDARVATYVRVVPVTAAGDVARLWARTLELLDGRPPGDPDPSDGARPV